MAEITATGRNMNQSTPSPFEMGRAIGGNIFTGGQQAQENIILDKILAQSQKDSSPQAQLDAMGAVLRNFSPERRAEALNFIEKRYQLAQDQRAREEFLNQQSPAAQGIGGTSSLGAKQSLAMPEPWTERAKQLVAQKPSTYRGVEGIEKAKADAKQEYATRESLKATARSAFNNSIQEFLQKSGNDTYKDIFLF